MIKSRENSLGAMAFLLGVILAVILGVIGGLEIYIPDFSSYTSLVYGILMILGIIVGFANVAGKESQTFMIAGVVLVIVSKFGMETLLQGTLGAIRVNFVVSSVFQALLALFIPATIIVALKTVFSIAKV